MKHYSSNTLSIFNNVEHVFIPQQHTYNFIGSSGDLGIGEYVKLYFDIELANDDVLNSKITQARFSAIGSPILIVSAEYLCRSINRMSITEALLQCAPDNFYTLHILEGREYSLNFVLQAFYDAIQAVSNYGCATV